MWGRTPRVAPADVGPGEDKGVAGPRRPGARLPCSRSRQQQLVQLVQARTSPAKMRGGQRLSSVTAACSCAASGYSGICSAFLLRQLSGLQVLVLGRSGAATAQGRTAPARDGTRAPPRCTHRGSGVPASACVLILAAGRGSRPLGDAPRRRPRDRGSRLWSRGDDVTSLRHSLRTVYYHSGRDGPATASSETGDGGGGGTLGR